MWNIQECWSDCINNGFIVSGVRLLFVFSGVHIFINKIENVIVNNQQSDEWYAYFVFASKAHNIFIFFSCFVMSPIFFFRFNDKNEPESVYAFV